MKKILRTGILPLCTVAFCIFLCGCVPKQPLDSKFLPIALGIEESSQSKYTLTVGGYTAAKSPNEAAVYGTREVTSDHIVTAFDENDLPYGTLTCLVVATDCLQEGLYPIYAPFIYNDDASEAMFLLLSDDPAQLLQEPAKDAGDLNSFLEENDFPTASIIGYDIAMRTPQEGIVLPVVSMDEEKHYQIDRAAVFQHDMLQGFMDKESFPYLNLLNHRPIRIFVPYQLSYDSGLVRLDLTCDISLQFTDTQTPIYHITVFAEGTLAAREYTHEDIRMQQEDIILLQHTISETLQSACLDTIRQAQACKTDVFGFTRLLLATDRSYTDAQLTDAFLNSTYSIAVQTTIRNLTQIH